MMLAGTGRAVPSLIAYIVTALGNVERATGRPAMVAVKGQHLKGHADHSVATLLGVEQEGVASAYLELLPALKIASKAAPGSRYVVVHGIAFSTTGSTDHGKLVWACKEEHLGEASHKHPKTYVAWFNTSSKRNKLRLAVARVGTRATSSTSTPLPVINHVARAGKAPAAGQSHRNNTAKRTCPSYVDVATQAGRPLAATSTQTVLPDIGCAAPKTAKLTVSAPTVTATPPPPSAPLRPLLTKTHILLTEPATPMPEPTGLPTIPETSTCYTPKLAAILGKQRQRRHKDMFEGQNNTRHTAKLKACNAAAQECLYALYARDNEVANDVFGDRSASMLISIADHMGIRENIAKVFGGGEELSPMYYVRLRCRTSMAWRRVYQTRAHAARRFKASEHVRVCSDQDIRDARNGLPTPEMQRVSAEDAAVVGESCRYVNNGRCSMRPRGPSAAPLCL